MTALIVFFAGGVAYLVTLPDPDIKEAAILGYKQGQIDCIQGRIDYELKTQPNGEVKWEEKK